MTVCQLPEVGKRSPGIHGHSLSLFGPEFVDESSGIHGRTIAFCYSSSNSKMRVPSDSKLLKNCGMDITAIRRTNLCMLIEAAGSIRVLADKVGTAPNYLSEIKNHERNMGNKLARKIEQMLGKQDGWMDTSHDALHDAPEELATSEPKASYIVATSPEDLARQLREKGNEDVLRVLQILLANQDVLNK